MKVMLVMPFTDVKPEHKNAPRPEIGDVDEVSDELKNSGKVYYCLARFGSFYAYQSDLFAPLPDADVTAEVEEKEKANLQPA